MVSNSSETVNKTSVFDVADCFLCLESMNPLKLQKLCYYAYAWWLANYDEKLFEEEFQAWVHGPVCYELYDKYRCYGVNGFGNIPNNEECSIDEDLLEYIKDVFRVYGKYSGNQLERLTHSEQPWIQARGSLKQWESSQNIISDKSIIEYYRSQIK